MPGNPPISTLIYVNSRQEAEEIQDFLRQHCPDCIPAAAFEFYHRHIDDSRKTIIQERLRDGSLRAVAATDALGMKVGRCVRDPNDYGEVVLFLTKTAWARFLTDFEADELGQQEQGDMDDELDSGDTEPPADTQMDRIVTIDIEDPQNEGDEVTGVVPTQRGKKKAARSAIEARDGRYLTFFIATELCRRKPWNDFFSNEGKLAPKHSLLQ
ncbi:hypothetical protein AAF712_014835 [Marasmius tenuissimus]|uniref:Uncharacterized protein n=1 Tax=Marasmius tenuissimus TaxID=585030 RepID=A0ABR2Z9Y5_9AGAR